MVVKGLWSSKVHARQRVIGRQRVTGRQRVMIVYGHCRQGSSLMEAQGSLICRQRVRSTVEAQECLIGCHRVIVVNGSWSSTGHGWHRVMVINGSWSLQSHSHSHSHQRVMVDPTPPLNVLGDWSVCRLGGPLVGSYWLSKIMVCKGS